VFLSKITSRTKAVLWPDRHAVGLFVVLSQLIRLVAERTRLSLHIIPYSHLRRVNQSTLQSHRWRVSTLRFSIRAMFRCCRCGDQNAGIRGERCRQCSHTACGACQYLTINRYVRKAFMLHESALLGMKSNRQVSTLEAMRGLHKLTGKSVFGATLSGEAAAAPPAFD